VIWKYSEETLIFIVYILEKKYRIESVSLLKFEIFFMRRFTAFKDALYWDLRAFESLLNWDSRVFESIG
jgi:hypothetical protein